ncbi:MAG TPA: acyl carrier protein [Bryobacteraceae bacterium]|nr:acyl carrier protein [Bryobacteraceae bacterium]
MSLETVIVAIILERLALPIESIRSDTPLFASADGGLELDSLASLDILAGLSDRFDLPFDDIEAKDFQTVSTLAQYLRASGIKDEDANCRSC